MSEFPRYRPRRMRRTESLRRLVRETRLTPDQLVLPLFVVPGSDTREEVESMPGVHQTSRDELLRDAEEAAELGLGGVILFGIPATKDELGSSGYDPEGVVQEAVRAVKSHVPELTVITDVCLCEYTSHGHCGILDESGRVLNDETLQHLTWAAVSHADAGADLVAPSDMMDGRVGAIRQGLDEGGHSDVGIMAYSAKYASAFYGPFRDAAHSTPAQGDRRGYQMDPPNSDEALREVQMDIREGADVVMVKPALPYLDIVRRVKDETGWPVAAYHVSGEYAQVMAADARGWVDGDRVMEESLLSLRRAGADVILTYWARRYARIWKERVS